MAVGRHNLAERNPRVRPRDCLKSWSSRPGMAAGQVSISAQRCVNSPNGTSTCRVSEIRAFVGDVATPQGPLECLWLVDAGVGLSCRGKKYGGDVL